MPDYLDNRSGRSTFAEKMKEKRNFKDITRQIKEECLSFGYGTIRFDKDKENLWVDDYENTLSASIYVDAIKIEFDTIMLCENNRNIRTFDHVNSIDRQIQIYETIYNHQDQLHYYELDWDHSFKAIRVTGDDGHFVWRILTPEEARHLWYNGYGELCELYNDGAERMIEDDYRLEECVKNGDIIVTPVL